MPQPIINGDHAELGTVEVETHFGDKYVMPAMDKNAIGLVLPKGLNRIPEGTPTLAMVNASYSVLSIPFHIIKAITIDGEGWWNAP